MEVDEYTLQQTIGKGSFAETFLGSKKEARRNMP
jgi:hypothetical protein